MLFIYLFFFFADLMVVKPSPAKVDRRALNCHTRSQEPMGVCGVRHAVQWRGGEGRKDITESYRGDQVQFIMKEPKPSYPHPLPPGDE